MAEFETMENMAPSAEITLAENAQPKDIAEFVVKVLDAKKAKDIKLLYVKIKPVLQTISLSALVIQKHR